MHQPTLTLTLTRLGAAVLALARRPGGGAPPWRWRAVLALAPSWRLALARRRVGGYAPSWRPPSWRLCRLGGWRAVPAAAGRLGGLHTVPAGECRSGASTALARARCPGACVPLWRERAVPAAARRLGGSVVCAIWTAAPAWRLRAVPAAVRWLGASAQSRRMRAFAR